MSVSHVSESTPRLAAGARHSTVAGSSPSRESKPLVASLGDLLRAKGGAPVAATFEAPVDIPDLPRELTLDGGTYLPRPGRCRRDEQGRWERRRPDGSWETWPTLAIGPLGSRVVARRLRAAAENEGGQ